MILPMYTWNALSKIPSVVSVGGVFLYGIWWITNRRKDVQRMEHENDAHGPNHQNHQNN
jgi:hypothetical protein